MRTILKQSITALVLLASVALASCAPAAPPPAPEKLVSTAAPAAPAAPAPTRVAEAPKPVVVTKEVEKRVVVITTPTPRQPTTSTPVPLADDWSRIQAAGKMIAGTSAGDSPFAYYTPDFKLDGFDVALIRQIARHLGVQVEIKDFAPDGLLGAVQLRQVDLAVAAIAATPDRAAVVDFTNPYYTGKLAIVVPKGSVQLREALNRGLEQVVQDGTFAGLAERYLGRKPTEPLLVPTPEPTGPEPQAATPVPPTPTACLDGMAWVGDLTYGDAEMAAPPQLAPGQPFVKGWRVHNTGTCPWDATYTLVYAQGNSPLAQMGGLPVHVDRPVPGSTEYDVYVSLVAPSAPGAYQGFWQMQDGRGTTFGERVRVGIVIPSPPTPTPTLTQTPTFGADRTRITAGECIVFTWNVEHVKEVYFYAQGEPWETHGVTGQDSQQVCPADTTAYALRIVHLDDSVAIRWITIKVEPASGTPTVARFAIAPGQEIRAGQCVDIQWEVQGNVSRVTILRDDVALWDGAPVSGNMQDCPPGTGSVTYTLLSEGPGGSSRVEKSINVTP